MSTRIIASEGKAGGESGAVLFEAVDGIPYGRVFHDGYEQAECFLKWMRKERDVEEPARLTRAEFDEHFHVFVEEWNLCGLTEAERDEYQKLAFQTGAGREGSREKIDRYRWLASKVQSAQYDWMEGLE